MKQILVIDVSPRGAESAGRRVAKTLTDRLHAQYPSARITHRDLVKDNLPHLDEASLKAISTEWRAL
jgi:FMN-dependent NADH-azoreductase